MVATGTTALDTDQLQTAGTGILGGQQDTSIPAQDLDGLAGMRQVGANSDAAGQKSLAEGNASQGNAGGAGAGAGCGAAAGAAGATTATV